MAGYLIGNYIHYRASNYLKYGATMSQKSAKIVNLSHIIDDKHEALKIYFQAHQHDTFKEEYEKYLNYVFGSSGQTGSFANPIMEQDILEQEFYQILKEKFPTIILNNATLNTSLDGNGENYGVQKIDINKRLSQGKNTITFKFLENQIKQLSILMF